jgi:eukaryotic-like serine/threonine-protein kinase
MSRESPPLPAEPHEHEARVAAEALIGREIAGRYKVVALIGRGGMSHVYEAVQAPLGRRIALKVLHTIAQDASLRRRFVLEAATTSRLTHPNTITVFDHGQTEDGLLFLAMELLQGRTLAQVIQREGALPPERAIPICAQICKSLREAHGLGVVHRDLKPANVFLLDHADEPDFVKVLDFGLVKAVGREDPSAALTRDGLFLGTAHYIAPEQARNQNPDQRADVYSLGVLLFHLLTGRVPFDGQSPVDVILRHVTERPLAPSTVRPDLRLPMALDQLVLRCLEKDREKRFQSMDEVLVALRLLQPGRVPETLPPPPSSRPALQLAPPQRQLTPPQRHVTPPQRHLTPPQRAVAAPQRAVPPSQPSRARRPEEFDTPAEHDTAPQQLVPANDWVTGEIVAGPSATDPGLAPRKRRSWGVGLAIAGVVLAGAAAAAVFFFSGSSSGDAPPPAAKPAVAAVPAAAPAAAPAPPAPAPPSPELAGARSVPDFVLRREAVSVPPLSLPEEAKAALRGKGRQVGIYRLCVGSQGRVLQVSAVQPIAGADAAVTAAIEAQWRYQPQTPALCAQVSVPVEVE